MYQTMAKKLRAEGRAEGKAEGKAEGELLTKVNMLERLLEKRFGDLPLAAEQRVRQAHDAQLEAWIDRIFDAKNLDDALMDG